MSGGQRRDRGARTLLEQLIWQREATYEEQAEEFDRLARAMTEPATMSVRHLQRLAAGQRAASMPTTRRVMRAMYGHSIEELLGPPKLISSQPAVPDRGVDAHRLAASAAHASLEFAGWADAEHVAPTVVEHVSRELSRIAVDYVASPLFPLFCDLVGLRDSLFDLVRGRPNPRQARELFFLTGTACVLLAHASQNLGSPCAAMAQTRAAWACAQQADHHGLRVWVRGTQALIAEWTRRPAEAVAFATSGQTYRAGSDSHVRLAAIEARALARLGDVSAALTALGKARKVREAPALSSDDLTAFGGLLTFPTAKQRYYAGSTLTLVRRYQDAECTALEAIATYESGPPQHRSYGDEALARVDVATARLAAGGLDGACEALGPVLALPLTHRIQQVSDSLTRIRPTLDSPRYAHAPAALDLGQRIEAFSPVPPAGLPVASVR